MRTQFIENLTSFQVKEYFVSLDKSQQAEIFDEAVLSYDADASYFTFDEYTFNEFFKDPFEAARAVFFGNVHWNDDYFYFNTYGNIETFTDLEEYFLCHIDTIETYIRENYEDELAEYFDEKNED